MTTKPEYAWQSKLRRFCQDLLQHFTLRDRSLSQNVSLVTVAHMVPCMEILLDALAEQARVVVIPKGSYSNLEAFHNISDKHPTVELDKLPRVKLYAHDLLRRSGHFGIRQAMQEKELALNILDAYVPQAHRILCLDIGGYFAQQLPTLLSRDSRYHNRIIAVSEGTKNGHLRFEAMVDSVDIPILSRAEDRTKRPENYFVGRDIIRATNALLIKFNDTPLGNGQKIGLIGFGNVGEPLGRELKSQGLDVLAYDICPFARINAKALGLKIVDDKQVVFRHSDLIFFTTGKGSFSIEDLRLMKDGVFLSFATSIDDEMRDYHQLGNLSRREIKQGDAVINAIYELEDKRTVNFLMDGKSTNFYMGTGVANPVVYLALGSWLAHVAYLLNNEDEICNDIFAKRTRGEENSIRELPLIHQITVAKVWEQHYGDLSNV